MKRFLICAFALATLALASVPTCEVKAQKFNMSVSDTVVDAGTQYLTIPAAQLSAFGGHKAGVSIQFKDLKISGTVAGTVTVETSNDGVIWVEADTVNFPSYAAYTITNTTGTQSIFFEFDKWNRYVFRLKVVGSGTAVHLPSATVVAKNF